MRKYFDRIGNKVRGAHEKMSNYLKRLFNHSNQHKISEGAAEVNKVITSAHGDQWRRQDKQRR